jgi:hypothetical protein
MFMNFGWYGVVAVSLLIGGGLELLTRSFGRRLEDLTAFALGVSLFVPFAIVESNTSLKLGSLLTGLIPFLFIFHALGLLFPRFFERVDGSRSGSRIRYVSVRRLRR